MAQSKILKRSSKGSFVDGLVGQAEKSLSSTSKHSLVGRANRWLARVSFGFKTKRSIYRRMATLTRQGVPVSKALLLIYNHSSDDGKKPNNEVAIIVADWLAEVSNGKRIGTAFRHWISREEVALLDAGEKSAKLADAFENALFIQQSMASIRGTIRTALGMPALIAVGIIVLLMMCHFVLAPAFGTNPDGSPRIYTGIAGLVFGMADGFYNMAPVIVISLIIGSTALMMSLPRMTGRFRVYLDRFPPYSYYKLSTGANFMISIGALLAAGVPVHEALKDLLKSSISPYYSERVKAVLTHVLGGDNFGDALLLSKFEFPDLETIRDLRTYAEMGVLEEQLEKMSKESVEENIEKIKLQSSIVNKLAMVIGGIFIGLIGQATISIQYQVINSFN